MTDWIIGWINWLKTVIYPRSTRRWVCARRGHTDVTVADFTICTRCFHSDMEAPRPTVQVGCPVCDSVIDIPFEFTVTPADEDGHQYLDFEPDMADLWAHSWSHQAQETP